MLTNSRLTKIEELSRNGNTINLQSIVAAMTWRLETKGSTEKPRSTKFDFEIGEMLRAYQEFFSKWVRIL